MNQHDHSNHIVNCQFTHMNPTWQHSCHDLKIAAFPFMNQRWPPACHESKLAVLQTRWLTVRIKDGFLVPKVEITSHLKFNNDGCLPFTNSRWLPAVKNKAAYYHGLKISDQEMKTELTKMLPLCSLLLIKA
jgi:hypothetical protein